MVDYHVFSSGDLKNWVDHGVVLHLNQVPWESPLLKVDMGADCALKAGCTISIIALQQAVSPVNRIWFKKISKLVATSKSPMGPFVPEPNPVRNRSIDPCVFIDDTDRQAYLFYGRQGHGSMDHPK